MIIDLLGPVGSDLFYVTICMLVCLGICCICDSLKSSSDETKNNNIDLDTYVEELPLERQTEPSDWVALTERKKIKAAERRQIKEEQRKIA